MCDRNLLKAFVAKKTQIRKMEEMSLNKATGLRRQSFCNPTQSEQMLLKCAQHTIWPLERCYVRVMVFGSWEDMESMLNAAMSPQHGQCRYKTVKRNIDN